MDLIDSDGRRALAYLAALERSGHYPTLPQLEAYVAKPYRSTTSPFGIQASALFQVFRGIDEALVDYLLRLDWVAFSPDGVILTSLGRAMNAAAEQEERSGSEFIDVVLDRDDPVVLAKLFRELSEVGEALLVDPYFRIDHLMSVLQATEVNRILTSEKVSKSGIDALAIALGTLGPEARKVEVRVADKTLHDRHVVGVDGAVLLLGASLNGVGSVTSVVVRMADSAEAVAANCELMWKSADVLEPIRPTSNTDKQRDAATWDRWGIVNAPSGGRSFAEEISGQDFDQFFTAWGSRICGAR